MLNLASAPPLSLYLHFPWCVRKCPYCDFNSHAIREAVPQAGYVDALLADLDQELPGVWGRPLFSIFIGGGTPSLLEPSQLERLMSGLRARFAFPPDLEVTLEANPGTAERERFAAYRAAGVTRLSLGVQSFNDAHLAAIGRIHNGRDAEAAVAIARAAGFDNLNLDLMYGLPGQTPAEAAADLALAIALAPEHVSYYQLTIEPNTAFGHAPPPLPGEEGLWRMHCEGIARLTRAGWARYETSAFARPGRQCRHNRNYWEFGDYLGIGAGAHGKRTEPQAGRIMRNHKVRHPRDYLARAAGPARLVETPLTRRELPLEFLMNALRLTDGFDPRLFDQRTGLTLASIDAPLHEAERRGLLVWEVDHIAPTELGRDHLDTLLGLFVAHA